MRELLNQLLMDQTFMATLPLITFGILGAIMVSYLYYQQRRERRDQSPNRKA